MPAPLDWIPDELQKLARRGLLRERRVVVPQAGGWCLVDGRQVRNFASNDYLDLAHDRRVIDAAEKALREFGVGARASALVSGRTLWHAALEERLAEFERQPAAIVFPTGYAANLGAIGALVSEPDAVYCDRDNHASLVDGCRLSRAKLRVYRHRDLDRLKRALSNDVPARRRLIVTDGVFSMEGDLAPLSELCGLAERYGAMILVDEAHATGVFGEKGRGACELAGVEQRVAVRVGTLSKAIGSMGGFVTGSGELVDWLANRARTQVYSTALPPSACAAAVAAIDIIAAEPERRRTLERLAAGLHERLAAAGLEAMPNAAGPIVPVVLKGPERTMAVARRLEDEGFLVGAIRPPTVPEGTSRLRISLTCAHSCDDVERLAAAIARLAGLGGKEAAG